MDLYEQYTLKVGSRVRLYPRSRKPLDGTVVVLGFFKALVKYDWHIGDKKSIARWHFYAHLHHSRGA